MVEGVVDGIESTLSSITFNRAALSGLWEVLSSGKRIRLALSTLSLKHPSPPQMRKSFQARTYIQLSPYLPIVHVCACYIHLPCNYIKSTKATFNLGA